MLSEHYVDRRYTIEPIEPILLQVGSFFGAGAELNLISSQREEIITERYIA